MKLNSFHQQNANKNNTDCVMRTQHLGVTIRVSFATLMTGTDANSPSHVTMFEICACSHVIAARLRHQRSV